MAIATRGTASNYLQRAPSPSGLADVVDLILDKGLVIDAYIRIAVIGIELITIDARIVIASVDTYLRFAAQVKRPHPPRPQGGGPPSVSRRGGCGPCRRRRAPPRTVRRRPLRRAPTARPAGWSDRKERWGAG